MRSRYVFSRFYKVVQRLCCMWVSRSFLGLMLRIGILLCGRQTFLARRSFLKTTLPKWGHLLGQASKCPSIFRSAGQLPEEPKRPFDRLWWGDTQMWLTEVAKTHISHKCALTKSHVFKNEIILYSQWTNNPNTFVKTKNIHPNLHTNRQTL